MVCLGGSPLLRMLGIGVGPPDLKGQGQQGPEARWASYPERWRAWNCVVETLQLPA